MSSEEADLSFQDLPDQPQAILAAIPLGVAVLKSRRLRWTNRALEVMLCYASDELCGVPACTLFAHQHDFERVESECSAKRCSGVACSTNVLAMKKDGTTLWCHLTGQILEVRRPQAGVVWTLSDITERRRLAQSLRRSELRCKRLLQNATEIVAVTNRVGVIQSISDSVVAILGYQPIEAVGIAELEFVHPDDREAVTLGCAGLVESLCSTTRIECRCRHKNGHWVPLQGVATNLLADPSVRGIVHNLRDVSERNQLAEQLVHSLKLGTVGRLTASVVHDFNNLLSVISGSMDLLRGDLESTGSALLLLNEASSAIGSAAALARQLLGFPRRRAFEPRVCDLNELVLALQTLLERLVGEGVVLRIFLGEQLGAIWSDPGRVEQVLMNLVANARDAMPHGGTLMIETTNVEVDATYRREHELHPTLISGSFVSLAVSDTGSGMVSAVQQHIFEPFFTTKPDGLGTGLGLANVLSVIEQAGGCVEVVSELGKGSLFRVYLPRVGAAPDSVAWRNAGHGILKGTETVLLVENEGAVRNTGESILKRLGYAVLAASGAREALALARSSCTPIRLLMTEVVMSPMDGPTLARAIAALHPEVNVLFTSGHVEELLAHSEIDSGCANFIAQPYTLHGLAQKLRATLDADLGHRP